MRNFNKSKGFTLMEFLISLAIFGIGITIVPQLLVSVVKNNTESYKIDQALSLAQNKIEIFLFSDNDSEAILAGEYEEKNNPVNIDSEKGGIYYLSWNISDLSPLEKKITALVKWDTNKKVKLCRIITTDGI